ncbi:cytochrome c biogenesis protein ResB [Brachybacterium sp. EF45031]|uniref:cytochrome c biogenesis protein ResB n=1 Tax=Brachybacterium sillae TaxID=2810536 RepID=UPI00217E3874|nr:cytochrome c biogenesis protein ResB [Brachybacterium sillae]MCS6711310.1 cytochrome c biogenesis protein ResB [Brachybacterium sillae]
MARRGTDATLPALGPLGWLRFLWRQLTSMQTALFLLMLLAIAAVPGSLYPQRNVNPGLTEQYLANNGRWAEILDRLGFFDVFSSPWFSAIYLLLFLSLIGCVVPRLRQHLQQLRAQPPRTPARLGRFVGHQQRDLPAGSDGTAELEAARALLRRRRYRLRRDDDTRSVSAERGYLRETGNLLFHLALLGVLIGVAAGHLTQYRGQITVVEGEGFSNSLTHYDSFTPGPWYDPSRLPDFRFTLEDFRAEYDTTPGEHTFGQPRMFEADVSVQTPQEEYSRTVRVNQPLQVPGADMFLLGNGYAPELTLTDPQGTVVADGPVIALPMDTGYTSQVVLKAPDARPEQTAVVGLFMPTAKIDERGPHSLYPDLVDPALALTVYHGDLGLDEGVPQNVYEIDVSTLQQVTQEDGSPLLVQLRPGEQVELPDGSTLAFTGVRRFAAFDIRHDPFQPLTLVMSLLALAGLTLSLFVPRRRVWVRVVPRGDRMVMEVAGLARSEDPSLADDVTRLLDRLVPQEAESDTTTAGADRAPTGGPREP